MLGVTEHHWLDYPDGGCADVDQDEAVRRVTEVMADVQPDTVLTFGPDGMTGHDDHKAACRWATEAFDAVGAGRSGAGYATNTPELAGALPGAAGRVQRLHGRRAAVHAARTSC